MIPRFELILVGLGFFTLVGFLLGWLSVALFRVMKRTPWGVRALRRWQTRDPLLEPWVAPTPVLADQADSSCSS